MKQSIIQYQIIERCCRAFARNNALPKDEREFERLLLECTMKTQGELQDRLDKVFGLKLEATQYDQTKPFVLVK